MPFIGKQSTANSKIKKSRFTATASQTDFDVTTGAGDELQVFLNGVLLKENDDYTYTTSTVTLGSPASVNDIVEVHVYQSFTIADTVDIAGDIMTGELTVPTVKLSSNVIKASDGGSTITLDDSDNVTIAGDLKVTNLKHASSGSNNLVLASDGNVSITNTLSAGTIGGNVVFPTGVGIGMAFLADVTDGYGGSSSTSATLRPLNQNIFNINCPTTISSNEFSFDESGTYVIYASAPAFRSERHILRLSDDSGSSFIGVGSAEFNVSSNSAATRSFLCKNITISSTQITGGGSQRDFGFWHIVDSAKATDGLGNGNNDTTTEQHLQVQIFRLA